MNHFRNILFGFLLVAFTSQTMAADGTIEFSCAASGGHRKANNQPLGRDALIEVGAFTVGFDPATNDRSLWKANWHSAGRVAYNIQDLRFDGSAIIINNNAPFTTSNKAWVWVFDRSGNWALFSNTGWFWPDTSFPVSFPLTCTPSTANIVIAGTVSATNPEIVCELVTDAPSPGLSFTEWASLIFPVGSRGESMDFDGDGQNNFTEYALGSDATDRNSFSAAVQVRNYSAQNYLSAKVSKGLATGITYTVQWSDNLSTWQTSGLTTVTNTAGLLEVRDANPIGTETKRFMRVLFSSP